MAPHVATEDLIDAQGVADTLGLSHRNTVSQYQRRYPDMPRPVLDLGRGRVKLWLRAEIEDWGSALKAEGRTRRKTATVLEASGPGADQRASGLVVCVLLVP